MYIRKTQDEWHLLTNYGYGHGYEIETIEDSRKEILKRLKEYRENAPEYSYMIKKVRIKKSEVKNATIND